MIIRQSSGVLLGFYGSALGFVSVWGRRMLTASNLLSLPGQARKAQPPAQVPKEPRLGVIPVPEPEREALG